ncbi:DUF2505 domain-containing protein [Sansalvadorimonas sp. 2012CJ34-2]|uniref:DUF2505 domain-containing protein n=1 Tax=Parendozoicomonas callyspongiae TaxID=2942213 RepID=A0ABT0PMN8_9GAMM|nr:DUF2505 domain-containing protein [Sansalvadorimonas sp. 2012CJ34-2]MCL6271738.1 DUF2505 domain-containing protein [Sansalvadorimonas sp. 2012CJ34-2]
MKIVTVEHHYNCQVNDVYRFFSSEEIISTKYEALGARKFRLRELSEAEGSLTMDSRREVPAGSEIPAALRKFLGEYNRVRQRESWVSQDDGSRLCTMRVDIDGVPVKVQGEMLLCPTGDGCVNHVTMEISSSIPLVGKVAASFVAENIEHQMEAEYQYILSETKELSPA